MPTAAVRTFRESFRGNVPEFLSVSGTDSPEGRVVRLPGIEDVSIPVQPALIVELLSK